MDDSLRVTATRTARDRVVFKALDAQADRLSSLHSAIFELEEMLLPVLGPSAATEDGPRLGGEQGRVSERLIENNDIVQGAINRIQDIMSRVEV